MAKLDREKVSQDLKMISVPLFFTIAVYHVLENSGILFSCHGSCSLSYVALMEIYQIVYSATISLMAVGIVLIVYNLSVALIDRYTVENGGETQ